MTKELFITELRKALAVRVSASEIEIHADYYREYISMEIVKGKSEEEVLHELGDPRLIAKSIIKARDDGANYTEDPVQEKYTEKTSSRKKLPLWVILLLVVLITVLVLGVLIRFVVQFLPIILIVIIIAGVVSFVQRMLT